MDAKYFPIQKAGEQRDNEMATDDADSEGESDSAKTGEESQDGQGDSNGGKDDKPQNGEKQDAKNASESSSLMSKLKDAFQNLLSKAKPQQNQQGSAQQGRSEERRVGKECRSRWS